MQVELVQSRRDLNDFIAFPRQIYARDPHWVPPLTRDVKFLLSDKHPFWRHAERALFLAREHGQLLGRVAAILDKRYVEFHDEDVGYFGFFEAHEDPQICNALLDAVSEWLRAKGLTKFIGPMNPSTNYECALLIEGFDRPPAVMMPYNPPYYATVLEQCGLRKARDLVALEAVIGQQPVERLNRLAERVLKRHPGLVVRPVNLRRFGEEVRGIREIYNSAWEKNWGFVPLEDDEIDWLAQQLKPIVEPELLQIAEVDGEPAGFLLALPDANFVLKKLNGRLGPVGILKALWYSRKIRFMRVMNLGLREQYRKRGIDVVLYARSTRAAHENGYTGVESSWILEDNVLTIRAAEMLGGHVYKRYRIYEGLL